MKRLIFRNLDAAIYLYFSVINDVFLAWGQIVPLVIECKSADLNGVHCKWEQDLAIIFLCCLIRVV